MCDYKTDPYKGYWICNQVNCDNAHHYFVETAQTQEKSA